MTCSSSTRGTSRYPETVTHVPLQMRYRCPRTVPYVRLTQEFNHGRLRAILASGQAVVLYRLAIMTKDARAAVHLPAEP